MKKFISNVVLLFVYLFFLGVFTFLIFTTEGALKIIGLFVMILFCINRIVLTIKNFFDEEPNKTENYLDTILAILGMLIFFIVIMMLLIESMSILTLLLALMYIVLVIFIFYFIIRDIKNARK